MFCMLPFQVKHVSVLRCAYYQLLIIILSSAVDGDWNVIRFAGHKPKYWTKSTRDKVVTICMLFHCEQPVST